MDNTSFNLLKLYSKRDTLSLCDLAAIYNSSVLEFTTPVRYLMDQGFVRIEANYAAIHGEDYTMHVPIQITYEGQIALEAEQRQRHTFKFAELRAWLTLAIALAAFIKGFFF